MGQRLQCDGDKYAYEGSQFYPISWNMVETRAYMSEDNRMGDEYEDRLGGNIRSWCAVQRRESG